MLEAIHVSKLTKPLYHLALVFFFIGNSGISNAQIAETHYFDHWRLGEGVSLQFDGNQLPNVSNNLGPNSYFANQSISDPITGAILFFTTINGVYDANGQMMPNSLAQGTDVLSIIPHPGNLDLFYLFAWDSTNSGKLSYSVVNMQLNSSLGDIDPTQKNVVFGPEMAHGQSAASDPSGLRHWLISHEANSDNFLVYSINSGNGLDTVPGIFPIGPVVDVPGETALSKISFGNSVLMYKEHQGGQSVTLRLCNFDPFTGILSDGPVLNMQNPISDMEISPNGQFLYVAHTLGNAAVFQYDLSLNDPFTIVSNGHEYSGTGQLVVGFNRLKLGPDGRLWIEPYAINDWALEHLTWFEYPDLLGDAAGLDTLGLYLGHTFLLNPSIPWTFWPFSPTLGIGDFEAISNPLELKIAPNPASSSCSFTLSQSAAPNSDLVIYDLMGRELKRMRFGNGAVRIELDVSDYPQGIYLTQVQGADGLMAAGRWVKQ